MMNKILHYIIALALLCSCNELGNYSVEPAKGSLYGIITDKVTGEPIRTAGVQLNPIGTKAVTGDDGQYQFTELPTGDYTLQVTKTGYVDLLGYKITISAGETTKGDVQIEKLPFSLRIIDDNGKDISTLDFGSDTGIKERTFSIFNDSPESINWTITNNCNWISKLSIFSGTLPALKQVPVIVTIDRNSLSNGMNTYILNITSDNGSKELTIRAGKEIKISITLNTLAATNITSSSATLNGEILTTGTPAYTERGFVYNTNGNPSIDNSTKKVVSGTGTGSFTANVTGLTANTTYYVRAYASNTDGTVYGNEISFNYENNHYMVISSMGIAVQENDIGYGNRSSAGSLCNSSELGGYNDWRLPWKEELLLLYAMKNDIGGFKNSSYWCQDFYIEWGQTSGSLPQNYIVSEEYYYVNMSNGTSGYHSSVNYNHYIRCVRTLP